MPRISPGTAQRFFAEATRYTGNDCLIWPYARKPGGYPALGKKDAHRLMCIEVRGAPPSDTHQAAHTCGNGKGGCINPNHLVWKTPKENQADRNFHGTGQKGAASCRAKLTQKQVDDIRGLKGIMSQAKIASIFGVSRSAITDIHAGKSWT